MTFEEHKPIFKQIADYIIDQIITGHWNEGDRIPSVREMAADVEVNPNTVARTYNSLNNQGLIYNQRGIGYFIDKGARQKILDIKKREFVEKELPALIKKMKLLNIDIDQIKRLYDEQDSEKK